MSTKIKTGIEKINAAIMTYILYYTTFILTLLSRSDVGHDVTDITHSFSVIAVVRFNVSMLSVTFSQSRQSADSIFSATTIPGLIPPYLKVIPMNSVQWEKQPWYWIGTRCQCS